MEVKMKYEEILEELQNYIDGCKRQKLSGNILVDKERIDEEIRKLSMNTPEEIKKYKHINKNQKYRNRNRKNHHHKADSNKICQ